MWDEGRPAGRFFCVCMLVVVVTGLSGLANAASPAMTTVNDIVYRADGTAATGTVLISWPAFTSADGVAVAAGTKSVPLEASGLLSVQLVPTAGATPANTYYSVVYQLADNTVRTEFWSVPTYSPATLAMIRTTPGANSSAGQMATRQYVDTAVAGRANDSSVVHVSGTETISGLKQFVVAPSVPTPAQSGDAANKGYVDEVVTNSGNGSWLSKAGDTMTGPLTLAGDPTAPLQAANRRYVDVSLGTKADLLLGLIPPAELGQGTTNGTLCLKGDSTWGACGTSSNAASIQNVPVDPAAPSDGQVITYEAASGKYKPKAGATVINSVFGRTGTITAQTGDYSAAQITGAEAKANKGVPSGYASLDSSAKVPAGQLPSLAESQVVGLVADLSSRLGNSGAQTLTGDLTATGKVSASGLQTTGVGPWTVEGAYGTMTPATTNNSKLGFGTGGKLSVSENAGPVTEVAKNGPRQFTYTFFDPNNALSMGLQVPSIYVNRAGGIHLTEVYCEIDAGSATVNLQINGSNVLANDLSCTTGGGVSSTFASGKDAVALAAKLGHVTTAMATAHRLTMVVKYTID